MLLRQDDPPAVVGDVSEHELEALIREARRRARLRRARWLAAAAAFGAVAWFAAGIGGGRHPRTAMVAAGPRPFVDSRAFANQGELAFVSRDALWVLDGSDRRLRDVAVPAGEIPSSPRFSADGRWLAYLVARRSAPSGPFRLWLARGDGTGGHQVNGLSVDQLVGWSSRSALVAVSTGASSWVPLGLATGVDVISPSGRVRALWSLSRSVGVRLGAIWSAVWSPGGGAIALSVSGPAGTSIREIALAPPHHTTIWFAITNGQRLPGICAAGCVPDEVIANLAGWWPRWGIAFWVYSSGMVHDLDSTPLELLSGTKASPRLLGATLSNGITDAIDASATGALAIVASSQDAGRFYGEGKSVETCEPSTRTCTPLPGASTWSGLDTQRCPCVGAVPKPGRRGSGVSLDPAWSPAGAELAYVKAPVAITGATPTPAWFDDHALYLYDARTGVTRRLGPIDGAQVPAWSRDGRELLYVASDGLWLTPASAAKPVEIAHPLFLDSQLTNSNGNGVGSFGQIPWNAQFSWYSR